MRIRRFSIGLPVLIGLPFWIGLQMVAVCAFAQGPGPGGGPGRGDRMGFGPPGPGARFLGAEAGMPGRVVKNAPYSADIVTESTQTLPDGNHIRQSTTAKFYRDSEGRTRSEQSVNLNGLAANANLPQVVFINDPVAGVNLALNTKDRTAAKATWMPHGRGARGGPPPDQAQSQAGPPRHGPGPGPNGAGPGPNGGGPGMRPHGLNSQNIKTESLGRQNIEGVPADGTRTTMSIPAGQMGNELPIQIVTESWYSAELHTQVLYRHSDPRTGETARKLANVSRSEPSPTLFEAPPDYKVTESSVRASRPGSAPAAQK
jgi:hypothetical protein